PHGPLPKLIGVLPRCCHAPDPPVDSEPPPDPGAIHLSRLTLSCCRAESNPRPPGSPSFHCVLEVMPELGSRDLPMPVHLALVQHEVTAAGLRDTGVVLETHRTLERTIVVLTEAQVALALREVHEVLHRSATVGANHVEPLGGKR